jgi:hypothetical protein
MGSESDADIAAMVTPRSDVICFDMALSLMPPPLFLPPESQRLVMKINRADFNYRRFGTTLT